MTPDDLTELEHPARLAKASGFTDVSINVDHLLELIAAARELEKLHSALDFFQGRRVDVDTFIDDARAEGWEEP